MSDLLVNINSAERQPILTVGTDLGMKSYPFVYFYSRIFSLVPLVPFTLRSIQFVFSSRSGGIQLSEAIKIKGLHERKMYSSQLAVTSNSHDSQFTCSSSFLSDFCLLLKNGAENPGRLKVSSLGRCVSQGWTGMYTSVAPSLSTKFIKNSHQNLPV